MVPPVGRVAGDARVGGRVHPVALEARVVGSRHVPARRLEPAVVVCEVDVTRRGVRVPSSCDGAVSLGVRPPVGLAIGDEPALGEVSVRTDPVALPADPLARGGNIGDYPVRDDSNIAPRVVGPAGVSVPAIVLRRLCGHGGLLRDGGRSFSGLDGTRGGAVRLGNDGRGIVGLSDGSWRVGVGGAGVLGKGCRCESQRH